MFTTKDLANLLELPYSSAEDIISYKGCLYHIIPLRLPTPSYRKFLYSAQGPKRFFFEDEFGFKKELCLSMLAHQMGHSHKSFYARSLSVKELSPKVSNAFFNRNHLNGGVQSTYAVGLFKGENLISAISYRKPFIKKHVGSLEIARFASVMGASVPGAFSKLFKVGKKWAEDSDYSGILSYADLRVGDGSVYIKSGFQLSGTTDLSYGYSNGKVRFDRFNFRAQDGLTEREYAEKMGVHKVYGFKNNIYLYDLT